MRWIAPGLAAFAVLLTSTGGGKDAPSWWAVGAASFTLLATRGLWAYSNHIPRTPVGRVGLIVAIVADDSQHEKQLRADFIAQLRKLLEPDKDLTKFFILELPRWACVRCTDPEAATRVLREARGCIMLYGTAKRRRLAGQESHLLEVEGIVLHAPITPEAGAVLSTDFRAVLPPRVYFPVDNDAFAFAATSELTEIAARYVIALAALVSADLRYSEQMLLSVEARLKSIRVTSGSIQDIGRKLPTRFIDLYTAWLNALYDAYFMSRRPAFLEEAERVVNALLKRDPTNAQALLFSAIAHFVLRRDVHAAKQAAYACRRITDQTWRYSYAFLLAYEGKTDRAREQYEIAFNGRIANVTVPVQVEEFIQIVLAEEPDQVQLHFFSGLVNLRAKGDLKGAHRDFEAFLACESSSHFPDEVALSRRYLSECQSTSQIPHSSTSEIPHRLPWRTVWMRR